MPDIETVVFEACGDGAEIGLQASAVGDLRPAIIKGEELPATFDVTVQLPYRSNMGGTGKSATAYAANALASALALPMPKFLL